jgi:glycosyltransferase involved in cell wall biosynthesis
MGGLETYVRQLVPELLGLRPGVRLTLFVNPAGREQLAREDWAGDVELVAHPLVGRRYTKAVAEAFVLGPVARRSGIQLLHSLAMTGPLRPRTVHVVTIGDVIWLYHAHRSDWATTATWKLLVPRVARRANRVITFSEASRHDLVDRLGIDAALVDVVPPGVGTSPGSPATDASELRQRLELDSARVVLTVSAKRPHKNLERLIEALPRVREHVPEAVLVMPGNPTTHERELRRLAEAHGVAGAVRFPPYVSPADLEGLYRLAECFVFPSLREGFGLPILEAMKRGVPVACSNTSSLPEVAGSAARYFDPERVDEIATAVLELLEDPDLSKSVAAAGLEQQKRFSWRMTAEGTLESYDRAWAGRSR